MLYCGRRAALAQGTRVNIQLVPRRVCAARQWTCLARIAASSQKVANLETATPLQLNPEAYVAAVETQPPQAGVQNDPKRQAKLAFLSAWVASGLVCYLQLSDQASELPPVPEWVGQAAPGVCAVLLLTPLLLKAVLRDQFHLELHRGQLYMQTGVPSTGPPIPRGAVVVRPTSDGRGNGAWAASHIPAGSHVCDYEGELLTAQQYLDRYTDGVSDFVMSLDDQWVSDASSLVNNTARFSAVHMNHSSKRANVLRYYDRAAKRVAFFAARDIHVGEELLFDYGRNYWRGREHLELP